MLGVDVAIAVGATAGFMAYRAYKYRVKVRREKKQEKMLKEMKLEAGEEEGIRETCRAMLRNLPLKRHRKGPVIDYGYCFTGEEAVNWMVSEGKAETVQDATTLCLKMLSLKLIDSCRSYVGFYCSKNHFYIFTPAGRSSAPALPAYRPPMPGGEIALAPVYVSAPAPVPVAYVGAVENAPGYDAHTLPPEDDRWVDFRDLEAPPCYYELR